MNTIGETLLPRTATALLTKSDNVDVIKSRNVYMAIVLMVVGAFISNFEDWKKVPKMIGLVFSNLALVVLNLGAIRSGMGVLTANSLSQW